MNDKEKKTKQPRIFARLEKIEASIAGLEKKIEGLSDREAVTLLKQKIQNLEAEKARLEELLTPKPEPEPEPEPVVRKKDILDKITEFLFEDLSTKRED